MTAIVLRGDARSLPLPDASVDLIVTSPPFLNLRSYTDQGCHYDGQIGTGTRERFLEDLWECTAEMARVLKPSGSIFVELGDSHTGKCLNDTPARYGIGCVDRLGLIKRANIIWHHVNGLPESATDRARTSHSVVFHLVKQSRYFTAVDEIREPVQADRHTLSRRGRTDRRLSAANSGQTSAVNLLGKLPGSVWEIPSQPLIIPDRIAHARCCGGRGREGCEDGLDHFAAFPMELPRRIILGWSPSGICTACGEGRRPVVDKRNTGTWGLGKPQRATGPMGRKGHSQWDRDINHFGTSEATITGYACACPEPGAPTCPAVVLDPFGGTGCTALIATTYGRTGVSVDRSADYCHLARWRTSDPAERARALGVPKPPPIPEGQRSLFDLEAS